MGLFRGALVRIHSRKGSVVLKQPVRLLYPLEICDCHMRRKGHIPPSDRRAEAISGQ